MRINEKFRWFFYFFCLSIIWPVVVFMGLSGLVALSTNEELNEVIGETLNWANQTVKFRYWNIMPPLESISDDALMYFYSVIVFYNYNIIPVGLYIPLFLYEMLFITLDKLPSPLGLFDKIFWFYYYMPVLPLAGKVLFFVYEIVISVPINISIGVSKFIVILFNINYTTFELSNLFWIKRIPHDIWISIVAFINHPITLDVSELFYQLFLGVIVPLEIIFNILADDFIFGGCVLYPLGLLIIIVASIGLFGFFNDLSSEDIKTNQTVVSEVNRWYKNSFIINTFFVYNCIFFGYFFYNLVPARLAHHNISWYNEVFNSYFMSFDSYSLVCINFFILFSIIFIKVCFNHLSKLLDLNTVMMLLMSLFILIILVQLSDLFLVYLGIVALSLSLYPLIALDKKSKGNLEAVVKYFFLGALASGLMLYGISLIYRELNTLSYEDIKNLDFWVLKKKGFDLSVVVGFIFLIFGFFFKLSLTPLQNWTPDVYLGSPTAVTCFLATVVKFGIYCTFMRSYYTIILDFFNESLEFKNLLIIFSLSSIIIGAVGAIDQFKIKRFIGFTTINQMGFITLGLCTQSMYGFVASYLYLCIYVLLNLIFFLFILNIKNKKGEDLVYMSDLTPFFNTNRMAGFVFIILLFSLAGMPPTIGFYMKLLILKCLIASGYIKLTVLLLYINVVSIFYYVRIIKIIFFDAESLVFFDKKELSKEGSETNRMTFSLLSSPFSTTENIDLIFKESKLKWKFCIYIFNQVFYYGSILLFLSGFWYNWIIYDEAFLHVLSSMWADLNIIDYKYLMKGGIDRSIHYFLRVV